MASIKIATGLKTYDIEDENGNVRGQISFNPSDTNIIKRATEVQKVIDKCINNAKNLDVKNEEEFVNEVNKIDNTIREQVNYLFDCEDVSDIVFGKQNVLSTLNGKTFVERFLEAFIPIIKKEFENEQKKSQERVNKYVKRVKK